jgi:hypothetical protein
LDKVHGLYVFTDEFNHLAGEGLGYLGGLVNLPLLLLCNEPVSGHIAWFGVEG